MGERSKIEWTDATWNPITGCSLVSEGCRNCYAAELAATRLKLHWSRKGLARRNAAGVAKFTGEVRFNAEWLDQPLRWRRPRMIFVCAHGDLFHEAVPDDWIDRVFAVMREARQHTFQVLTKRPERLAAYAAEAVRCGEHYLADHGWLPAQWPLPNVWLGTSCEDQATVDQRIPHLLATPAAVRFVSLEPLLGPIGISWYLAPRWYAMGVPGESPIPALDWVIVGGESGRNARPMHPNWVRSIRDRCRAARVPFFFKQWGEWAPLPYRRGEIETDLNRMAGSANRTWWPEGDTYRLGKKRAGRLLDGRLWDELPA